MVIIKMNLSIEDDLAREFQKKCIDERITMSEKIRNWIKEYLEEK